jgi:ketosteroid isomerase-like protein
MKLTWVICAAFLLTGGIRGTAQTPAPAKTLTPLEQTLTSAEKDFIAAAKKGDAAFFKRTLAEDFSFVGYDGQLYGRQDLIDGMADGGLDLQPYNMKVVSAGENTAIVTYDVILRVPPAEDQGPPPRYQHFSSVWVKQGDGWKLKFQQTTPTHWGDW